jgi:hypothetical protein
MNAATVRLFQRAVHLWLLGYLVSALPAAEWLWEYPVGPALPVPGPAGLLVNAFGTWLPGEATLLAVPVLMVFAAYGLWREQPVWMAFLTWMLFASLVQRAWLASCGGLLLMDNVLLWMVLLRSAPTSRFAEGAGQLAFHAIRVQVTFTYLVTGLHKLGGTSWTGGTAVGIVASDPQFGPAFLAHVPWLSAVITWALLAFQFIFPVAVWLQRTRLPLLAFGVLFHLGTALWMGIPEMGFAFIACYAVFLHEEEARAIMRRGWSLR